MTHQPFSHDDPRLNRVLERWMRDEAPTSMPGHVLDAVRLRAETTPQRAGRRRSTLFGGLLIAAAAAALGAVAVLTVPNLVNRSVGVPASASPTSQPSDTPTPSETLEPSPSPSPVSGLADPGDMMLRLTEVCDVYGPVTRPTLTVTSDGRAVWLAEASAAEPQGYLVRRLTADGLAELRSRVEATGLLDTSARYVPEPLPDVEVPGQGACSRRFEYVADAVDEAVVVNAVQWFGDDFEAEYFQPSPERKELDALAGELNGIESWLGRNAWDETPAAAYRAGRFLVVAAVAEDPFTTEGAPDVDEVSWPFDEPPDAFGEPAGDSEPQQRCAVADAAAVERLADELAARGLEQFEDIAPGAGVTLPWASHDASVNLLIYPQLPDGAPGCDAVS